MQQEVLEQVFAFQAEIESSPRVQNLQNEHGLKYNKRETETEHLSNLIQELEERSASIERQIQLEIRKALPNYKVSVEIGFVEGSLLAIGSVLLVAWGIFRPILEESIKDAIKPELTKVIQSAIKHVLTRSLERMGVELHQPIEVKVEALATNTIDSQQGVTQNVQTNTSVPTSTTAFQQSLPRSLTTMTIINTIGICIVFLILLIFLVLPHISVTLK